MLYIGLLILSIFFGPRLFAITTPVAQLSIYRALVLSLPLVMFWKTIYQRKSIYLVPQSSATYSLGAYSIWWVYGIISIIWVVEIKLWFQAIFLMSMGIFLVYALYFFTPSLKAWYRLVWIAYASISLQVIWGYFEILTNRYIFADLGKLDKYRTFSSRPLTRIPITYFANQNDYAILMVFYLVLCFILFRQIKRSKLARGMILLSGMMAIYLIYRSGSRMSLLVMILFVGLMCLSQIKVDLSQVKWKKIGICLIGVGILIYLVQPSLYQQLVLMVFSANGLDRLSGDMARINLYKNGFIFLAETFGTGVGAGNIEAWMSKSAYFPVSNLANIHNWWLEILVGYGVISFICYSLSYYVLIRSLWGIRKTRRHEEAYTASCLLNFMIIFTLASITSANNMLIEWHWAVFGLIIAYIKLNDQLKKENEDGTLYSY